MLETVATVEAEGLIYNHLRYSDPEKENCFTKDAHNEYELLFFLEGNATYMIEERQYKLQKKDLVIIRPSLYHYIRFEGNERYERYNLRFSPEALPAKALERLSGETEVLHCKDRPELSALFEKLDGFVPFGEEAFCDLLRGVIRELFYTLAFAPVEAPPKGTVASPLVQRALGYMEEHLFTVEEVSEIAKALFVTKTYFFRVFKEEMGISPMRYITQKRLLAAQKRIREGEKATAVSALCGFRTYPAFYKQYCAFFGCSPSKTV